MSDKEKELLDKIQTLENRVSKLENYLENFMSNYLTQNEPRTQQEAYIKNGGKLFK